MQIASRKGTRAALKVALLATLVASGCATSKLTVEPHARNQHADHAEIAQANVEAANLARANLARANLARANLARERLAQAAAIDVAAVAPANLPASTSSRRTQIAASAGLAPIVHAQAANRPKYISPDDARRAESTPRRPPAYDGGGERFASPAPLRVWPDDVGASAATVRPVAHLQPVSPAAPEASEPPESSAQGSSAPKPPEPLPSPSDSTVGGGNDEPQVRPINLETALDIASGQNPRIQFALARIRQSYAELTAARALWLPTLRAGANYNRHDGQFQDVLGKSVDVNRSSLNTGLGVGTVGAASQPYPGVGANFRFTDAVFQPRIADRRLAASQFAADAATNDTLRDVAVAYFELLRAMQLQAIAMSTRDNALELAKLTDSFARNGQGAQADADRAQVELTVRENEVQRTTELVDTASAELSRLLSVDIFVRLLPVEETVVPIELVSWQTPVRQLVATGLANRPELAEAQSLVASATAELERERFAPLLPSVLLGFSYAGFGGGLGASGAADGFSDRLDYDAVAYWEVRNLGFGERAARNSALGRTQQTEWRRMQMLDQVATEVVQAHAQVRARAAQIETAEKGVEKATDSYRRNLQRIREGVGLPIEVLQAIQALDQARREYVRTVIDYNIAQFRLQWALGWR